MTECIACYGNGFIRQPDGRTITCQACLRRQELMEREEILRDARELICGDRAADYGNVKDNFRRIAAGWGEIFGHPVTMAQVALCMDWVKTSRLITSPAHRDSWVDKAGYTALGWECSK